MMTFNYHKIPRIETEEGRKYLLPDGSKVSSVTTILDKTKSEETKAALQNWRKSVGEARAREITTEASSRGTRMHKWLETYALTKNMGEPGTNPYSQQSFYMAKTIVENALLNVQQFYGIECPLYYTGLYAGTSDCVALWKNSQGVVAETILDFKQSNKLKKKEHIQDYFCQLAAYAHAHNHLYGTEISRGAVLIAIPTEDPKKPNFQQFEISGDEFDHYSNLWWSRVEKFYL